MSALDNAVKLADVIEPVSGLSVGLRVPTVSWLGGDTYGAISLRVTQGFTDGTRVDISGRASGNAPTILANSTTESNVSLKLSSLGTGAVEMYTNGINTRVARFLDTASGVNYWDIYGSAANGNVRFVASGSDTDIDAQISPKGTGTLVIPIANIRDFANDAAAAAASPAVPVGGLYRNGSVLMIRVS